MATGPTDCNSGRETATAENRNPRASERTGYVSTCFTPPEQVCSCKSLRGCGGLGSKACVACVSVFFALLLQLVNWATERDEGGECSAWTASSSFAPQLGDGGTLCHLISPAFTLLCAFFWLGLHLIRGGVLTRSFVLLLVACHVGEASAQWLVRGADEQFLSFTDSAAVLACLAGGALMVVGLGQGVSVIVFVSVVRAFALFSLQKVRAGWRPYVAHLLGVLGVLLARYADQLLLNHGTQLRESCASVTGARENIPVFKRHRRSSLVVSSDMAHHARSSSKSHRRVSLPCIQKDQVKLSSPISNS